MEACLFAVQLREEQVKETFAERYVKKEDYAALKEDLHTLKNERAEAISCLADYRRDGHLFCWKWPWDWRCRLCRDVDRILEAWRERP